jgi:hypothetical protein
MTLPQNKAKFLGYVSLGQTVESRTSGILDFDAIVVDEQGDKYGQVEDIMGQVERPIYIMATAKTLKIPVYTYGPFQSLREMEFGFDNNDESQEAQEDKDC